MRTLFGRSIPICATALSLAFAVSTASAFALRSPQISFNVAPLQGYLNTIDPGINVATQQLDAQTWATGVTGNAEFTIMLVNGGAAMKSSVTSGAIGNAVGIYNASQVAPVLFEVFPATAGPGWYAVVNFAGGNLNVALFDQNSLPMGQRTYAGVNPSNFAFYIMGPAGLLFSQDFRNPNGAQMLTFDSPSFPGNYWLCFEQFVRTASSTFNGVVFNVQSLRASPAFNSSWGGVKGMYR